MGILIWPYEVLDAVIPAVFSTDHIDGCIVRRGMGHEDRFLVLLDDAAEF